MILSSFFLAIGQFSDPRFRRVLWLGFALAVALLFAMYAVFLMIIQWFTPDTLTLPWIGEVDGLPTLLSFASVLFMLALSVFLMVPVASAFTGLFLDDVVDAVETRHYPNLPRPVRVGFLAALVDSIRYFGVLVGLNLVGLVITIFSGGLGLIVLLLINGYLLSREYFTMIALRRMTPQEAHDMRRANMGRLWLAGVLMALPLTIPVVNLFIPILGAATFAHLFHKLAMR